ncbi:MAG: LamG domain-containing protein [Planctomycetes bacterium]|nr:LamG domain-containing protein [Planctomycetota bacterium]
MISQEQIISGQWHHVGLVYGGRLKSIYLDGVEVAQSTILNASQGCFYGKTGLYICASCTLQTDFFSGLIEDVRRYNAGLNTDEIASMSQ